VVRVTATSAEQLFVPGDVTWRPVESALAKLRRTVLAVVCAVVAVAGGVGMGVLLGPGWAAIPVAAALVAFGWGYVLIGRNQRSWRYAERAEDLLVSHGVMFRNIVVVPYGRMQYIDVQAGPLARMFDLAVIELHTATPDTDARIPGLRPADAARLRDRLAALGNAAASGL